MSYNNAFSEAARDLEDLVKSKRRRSQSIAEMSDDKDYDDADLDDSDRRAAGARRPDMRSSWRGIQAYYAEKFAADEEELDDLEHAMLVSGRPSRIRFPGARGDSALHSIDADGYIEPEDDYEEGRDRIAADNRARYGGDLRSWRAQASKRGVGEDEYATGKSFGMRNRARRLTPADLLNSRVYEMLKSKLQDALSDGLNPDVVMQFESIDPRLGLSPLPLIKALSFVPARIKRKYGIPALTWDRSRATSCIAPHNIGHTRAVRSFASDRRCPTRPGTADF